MASEQCPGCGAVLEGAHGRAVLECSYCGTQWRRVENRCPACGAMVEGSMEACGECGEPLSTFSRVLDRLDPLAVRRRVERSREVAEHLRTADDAASRRRMGQLEEIDRKREEAYREAEAAERQNQKRLLWIAAGITVTIVILLAVAAVLVSG
jgi:primosomal protein N'